MSSIQTRSLSLTGWCHRLHRTTTASLCQGCANHDRTPNLSVVLKREREKLTRKRAFAHLNVPTTHIIIWISSSFGNGGGGWGWGGIVVVVLFSREKGVCVCVCVCVLLLLLLLLLLFCLSAAAALFVVLLFLFSFVT